MKRSYSKLPTATTTTITPSMTQAIDYSSWSREDLITRLTALEQKTTPITPSAIASAPTTVTPEVKQKPKKQKQFDWSKHDLRFVALRFAYLGWNYNCLLYTSPSPRDRTRSRMPSSA